MNTRSQSPSLAARVAALPSMPMKDLWALWDQHFNRRPRHHHRTYVEGRVAYCMQQAELGGISNDARKQLIKIGESLSAMKSRRKTEIHVVPGTVLAREYDNHEHRVTAQEDGCFEYKGTMFKSLSAVARCITGCQWSGPVFFGLTKSQRRPK